MQFKIEQIAIIPKDAARAKTLLVKLGMTDWIEDHVVATGEVFGLRGGNSADLSFNYQCFDGKEFEVLDYKRGPNWMDTVTRGRNSVSHLGMHCSAEELIEWRAFFEQEHIGIAQEVMTQSHSNPHIAGKRWYNYVIFDTKEILGVDLKFIVRRDSAGEV